MHFLIILAFFATAHARAVNISNTWVLPEEGFPVFYRYFRDRISWYEADAVCQFHHANLVTVDTTAQYDAVRAYLKELDISSAVWVGLIRSNPEGEFTWTDYRGLGGDGYWSSAPDPRIAPLCAAADPTGDYRWEARACGGPTVASFICELPVPQWAIGNEGCMVRALPALTILYLPESAAVQLTADCGLAGVKRVQCTGNVKREELLRDLSCAEEVESLNVSNSTSFNNTNIDIIVSENQESSTMIVTEVNTNFDLDNESDNNNSTTAMVSISSKFQEISGKPASFESKSTLEPMLNEMSKILIGKNINLNEMHNNNLQSNDIPSLINNDHFLTNYRIQKIEDEENMQHKKLHDELARLGNFETIFTQPTDHFVPPLVIAKAKLSDDMTVLSLEEKHAQYFGAHNTLKHSNDRSTAENMNRNTLISTEQPNRNFSVTVLTTERTITLKDDLKKDMKINFPKKYVQREFESKISDSFKGKNKKVNKENIIKEIANQSNFSFEQTPLKVVTVASRTENTHDFYEIQNDTVIDLIVTLRETNDKRELTTEISGGIDTGYNKNVTIEYVQKQSINETTENFNNTQFLLQKNTHKLDITGDKMLESGANNNTVINNTTGFDDSATGAGFATKAPIFKDEFSNMLTTKASIYSNVHNRSNIKSIDFTTESLHLELSSDASNEIQYTTSNITVPPPTAVTEPNNILTQNTNLNIEAASTILFTANKSNVSFGDNSFSTIVANASEAINTTENMEPMDKNTGDLETIDDFQSPLLSAANEPLQRPNRSRRPKQPLNRINKFNPFRILG